MALFGRDYDRDYGYRGYDRGNRGTTTGRGQWGATTGYGYGRGTGYYGGTTGYDRGYRGDRGDRGSWFGWGDSDRYDANYKRREQTDFGDPFGDRQAQTPIRMIRERYDDSWFGGGRGSWFGSDYDRGYRGYDRGYRGYDRGYRGTTQGRSGAGVGYDPYEPRGTERYTGRGGGADYRRNRDYDRGWF